jgi:hypothetical protein
MKQSFSVAPVVVATVASAGEGGTANTLLRSVWLKIPSAKLLAHLAIVGSPDGDSAGVGFASTSKWQLTPHVLAAEAMGSRPAPLANVFRECDGTDVPQPLPGGYEIHSAVRLWRARLTLKGGTFTYVDDNGATVTEAGYGRIVASCTIEPAPEVCLSDAEFQALAGQCDLWVDGPPAELEI